MAVNVEKLKSMSPLAGMDFHIAKIGHVVLQVSDLERATDFYTRVLPFERVSGAELAGAAPEDLAEPAGPIVQEDRDEPGRAQAVEEPVGRLAGAARRHLEPGEVERPLLPEAPLDPAPAARRDE